MGKLIGSLQDHPTSFCPCSCFGFTCAFGADSFGKLGNVMGRVCHLLDLHGNHLSRRYSNFPIAHCKTCQNLFVVILPIEHNIRTWCFIRHLRQLGTNHQNPGKLLHWEAIILYVSSSKSPQRQQNKDWKMIIPVAEEKPHLCDNIMESGHLAYISQHTSADGPGGVQKSVRQCTATSPGQHYSVESPCFPALAQLIKYTKSSLGHSRLELFTSRSRYD